MKLNEFKKHIDKLLKKHPETKDYNVITSGDDEGNYFNQIAFIPTIGHLDSFGEFEEASTAEEKPNVVCLN